MTIAADLIEQALAGERRDEAGLYGRHGCGLW